MTFDLERLIREGGSAGMFSVCGKSANETAIALDDKHLKAYISVLFREDGSELTTVTCSTIVRFHNRLGRVYFWLIRPFHGLAVKGMLKHVIRKLTA